MDKTYTTWTLELAGEEQANFSMKEIDYHLKAIKNRDIEFMILTPLNPIPIKSTGYACNFVQLCLEDDSEYFHFEISITNAGQGTSSVIYGKDRMYARS